MLFRSHFSAIFLLGLTFIVFIHVFGGDSPGGGFQAGAIFGSLLLISVIFFGIRVPSIAILNILGFVGVFLYVFSGIITFLFSGHVLDYPAVFSSHHLGVSIVETGVAIVVATSIFRIGTSLLKITSFFKHE